MCMVFWLLCVTVYVFIFYLRKFITNANLSFSFSPQLSAPKCTLYMCNIKVRPLFGFFFILQLYCFCNLKTLSKSFRFPLVTIFSLFSLPQPHFLWFCVHIFRSSSVSKICILQFFDEFLSCTSVRLLA